MATDVAAAALPQHSVLDLPKVVQDGRKKVLLILEEEVLDYKHNGAPAIEDCVMTLATYFGNVVDNPEEDKYRRIKVANKNFQSKVCRLHTRNGQNPGERLMLAAGWKQVVVEMQRYWVFDAPAGDIKFDILKEARLLLDKALASIHSKAVKQQHESELRRTKHQEEKERVLLAIEDDKRMRLMTQQLGRQQAPGTAPSISSRSSVSPRERSSDGAAGSAGSEGGAAAENSLAP